MKVSITIVNSKDSLDVINLDFNYYKNIDPKAIDFYDNLNEIDSIVKKEYPGYYLSSISPTIEMVENLKKVEGAFGNEIPIKKITPDEAKKAGLL